MTVKTEEEVVATPAAEGTESDDAAFNAGFDDTATEEIPPQVTEPPIEEPSTTEAPAAPEYVQVTKAQLDSFLGLSTQIESIRADSQKKIDTAFGKVGGLERRLQEMQGATPAGYTVEVTDDIVDELREEFPELGARTLAAFKKFATKLKGTGPATAFDPNAVAPMITESARGLQRDILSIKHEDWETIVGLPDANGVIPATEYREWLAKQPAEVQAKLSGSWDARELAKSIDTFKAAAKASQDAAAKDTAEKARVAAEALKNGKPSARQRTLAAAANAPRGEGGRPAAPTEEDDFNSGFNSG